MFYKGRELKCGSDCYAAAMELAKHAAKSSVTLSGMVALLLKGAEWGDRFCLDQLRRILKSRSDFMRLDSEDRATVSEVVEQEDAIAGVWRRTTASRGVFGVWRPVPVNHTAAMGFQRQRD